MDEVRCRRRGETKRVLGGSKGQRKLQVETRVKTKVAVDEMHRKRPRISGLATRRRAARGRQRGQG